jgi:DNA-binding transcriptional regulator YdaS (Cro superfamily)
MQLEAWLTLKGIKKSEFARLIGSAAPTVTRIIAGTQNIPLSIQDAIFKVTEGAVTPDDLHAAYVEAKARTAA